MPQHPCTRLHARDGDGKGPVAAWQGTPEPTDGARPARELGRVPCLWWSRSGREPPQSASGRKPGSELRPSRKGTALRKDREDPEIVSQAGLKGLCPRPGDAKRSPLSTSAKPIPSHWLPGGGCPVPREAGTWQHRGRQQPCRRFCNRPLAKWHARGRDRKVLRAVRGTPPGKGGRGPIFGEGAKLLDVRGAAPLLDPRAYHVGASSLFPPKANSSLPGSGMRFRAFARRKSCSARIQEAQPEPDAGSRRSAPGTFASTSLTRERERSDRNLFALENPGAISNGAEGRGGVRGKHRNGSKPTRAERSQRSRGKRSRGVFPKPEAGGPSRAAGREEPDLTGIEGGSSDENTSTPPRPQPYAWRKSSVLQALRKVDKSGRALSCSGSSFHQVGARTEKSPAGGISNQAVPQSLFTTEPVPAHPDEMGLAWTIQATADEQSRFSFACPCLLLGSNHPSFKAPTEGPSGNRTLVLCSTSGGQDAGGGELQF
ncbi:uncharacterized protein LOC143836574 isoform X2 [Paroedura picta]|uniref:uncharacterized protein LOC143836574 isoform X2 n=1 Tax=Paroedura picta TaxID=143630 RepID=UPI0040567532